MNPETGEIVPPDPNKSKADAAEQTQTEATTEEAPAAGSEGATDDGEVSSLDDASGIAPADFAKTLEEKPELKALLDADPELKNSLFANSRKAAKLDEFQQIFRSPEEAKFSAEQHGRFSNLKTIMGSLDGTPTTAAEFIEAMLPESYLLNEDGTPQLGKNGKPVHDGSVYKFLKGAYQLRMDNLMAKYQREGDEEAAAAVDILMERQGFKAPSTPNEEGLSAELKQQKEAIAAERAELDSRKKAEAAERTENFLNSVDMATGEAFEAEINKRLKVADGLSAPEATVEMIKQRLAEVINSNPVFTDQRDQLLRRPQTEAVKKELVALNKRFMHDHLGKILADVLASEGTTEIEAQQNRQLKQAARADASRSEARTASTGTSKAAPAPMDGAQLRNAVTTELQTKLGRRPSETEILTGVMLRRQAS
jgi:hypothetical protein